MNRRPRRFTHALVALATLTACATPVGITREHPELLYRSLTRSVLSDHRSSAFTEQLLRRHGFEERYEQEPEKRLDELRRIQTSRDRDHERLFALAELYFLHGGRAQKRECYLAAALYAHAFLASGERRGTVAPQADPCVPLAAELYNVGLTLGLILTRPTAQDGLPAPSDEGILANRTLPLPFGELELRHDPEQFRRGSYRLTRFIPLIEYKVRGLRNRYRQPGIGVPLAAELAPMGSGARYRSAHLDGVASEKIVRSSHSMQSNPDTILEVRRILREHLDAQRYNPRGPGRCPERSSSWPYTCNSSP